MSPLKSNTERPLFFLTPEDVDEADREETFRILTIQAEKLGLLLKHYGVDPSDEFCWTKLAWHLAADHVPGMQVIVGMSQKKGRPRKWQGFLGLELVEEIDKISAEHRKGIKHAIGISIKRNPDRWGSVNSEQVASRYYEIRKWRKQQMEFLQTLLRPT